MKADGVGQTSPLQRFDYRQMKQWTRAILHQPSPYLGTADPVKVAKRRAKNAVAKASRKLNRP